MPLESAIRFVVFPVVSLLASVSAIGAGCRPATPDETGSAGAPRDSDPPEDGASAEGGASGTAPVEPSAEGGGRRHEETPPESDTPSDGGESGSDAACAAPLARLAELADGSVRDGTRVELSSLVATSYEFLVYRSESTGACLWGIYAAEALEPASAETSGLSSAGVLLVSYGEPAPSADAECPRGAAALPLDVVPGSALVARGEVARHAPEACAGGPASVQLRIEPRCPLLLGGRGAAPPPAPISAAEADAIARGDADALATFGGGLVELRDVNARAVPGESDAVGPYGVMRFEETELEVHDALAFMDVRGTGPGDFDKSFEFAYPAAFSRVSGIVHLDYCTWTLAPRDGCADFAPSAASCGR